MGPRWILFFELERRRGRLGRPTKPRIEVLLRLLDFSHEAYKAVEYAIELPVFGPDFELYVDVGVTREHAFDGFIHFIPEFVRVAPIEAVVGDFVKFYWEVPPVALIEAVLPAFIHVGWEFGLGVAAEGRADVNIYTAYGHYIFQTFEHTDWVSVSAYTELDFKAVAAGEAEAFIWTEHSYKIWGGASGEADVPVSAYAVLTKGGFVGQTVQGRGRARPRPQNM